MILVGTVNQGGMQTRETFRSTPVDCPDQFCVSCKPQDLVQRLHIKSRAKGKFDAIQNSYVAAFWNGLMQPGFTLDLFTRVPLQEIHTVKYLECVSRGLSRVEALHG